MRNYLRRLCSKYLIDKTTIRPFMLLILIILFCIMIMWDALEGIMQSRLLRCYHEPGNKLIELNENEVSIGKCIFFHETSCQQNGYNDIKLQARQGCSVESAALHHPNNDIYLLIPAPVGTELNTTRNEVVKALLQYPNFKIRHINIDNYVSNTPMDSLVHGHLQRSRYPISHASDVLRYTTLLKFRGTYMDLDVIVLKHLLDINNFVGMESVRSLGAGVINFGPDKLGEEMAKECAQELKKTFQGKDWGNNGPGVITRVLYRKCNTTSVSGMLSSNCQGFHVLPENAFYAFPFWESSMFFKPGKLQLAQEIFNSSLVIHFWNRKTERLRLPVAGSGVPFSYYAKINCPRVYEAVNGDL